MYRVNLPPSAFAALRSSAKVFLVFLAVYFLTWGAHYTTADGAHKIAWAQVMLFGRAANGIERGPDGTYSKYGIGHSLVAMPPLALAHFIRQHTGIHCEAALYTLVFIVNGALLVALIAYYLFHFFEPKRVWWTVGLIGLATMWWPYTKLDFSEPLVATGLFAGFVLMRFGRPTVGMLVAGLILTIRTDSSILIALLGLWWLLQQRSLRTVLKLSLALLPSVGICSAANYLRYRSIFDHGYAAEPFSTPMLQGLIGILFSAGKSVFLFSPPLLLGFAGWKSFCKSADRKLDGFLFLAVFVAQLLLYSRWWDWSSDDAWGVRFMIAGVVLMCIPAVELVQRRNLFLIMGAAGVFIQLLGILPGPMDYLILMRGQEAKRRCPFFAEENRVDFEDIRFNPRYSQMAGNWILLRELLHLPPHASSPEPAKLSGTPLYDTLPPRSWSDTAHWDLVWVRAWSRGK